VVETKNDNPCSHGAVGKLNIPGNAVNVIYLNTPINGKTSISLGGNGNILLSKLPEHLKRLKQTKGAKGKKAELLVKPECTKIVGVLTRATGFKDYKRLIDSTKFSKRFTF